MPPRVVLVQVENTPHRAKNLERVMQALTAAESLQAHLVVFPEGMLTGFTAAPEPCSAEELAPDLERVQAWARRTGIDVLLPSVIQQEEANLNALFLFQAGECRVLYKQGLTESEQRFFTPREDGGRVMDCHGHRLGVVVCREVHDPPDRWIHEPIDALLWPAYWGWGHPWEEVSTGDDPVVSSLAAWSCPVLQSTFTKNNGTPQRTSPDGRSLVIHGERVVAQAGTDDCVILVQLGSMVEAEVIRLDPCTG